jgi:hypothetical protein
MTRKRFREIQRRVSSAAFVRTCLTDKPLWYERDLEALLAFVRHLAKKRRTGVKGAL